MAGAAQLDPAGGAVEQHRAQVVLQSLDLAADGGLGQVQFFGGGAEAEVPGDGLEAAQAVQGERAMGWSIHDARV